MSVQITDCTIRDGGYLLNKDSSPDFVKAVLKGLAEAGIDFVETGFLQDRVGGESIVYRDLEDAGKYLPEEAAGTNFLGFCDNSRYSVENLGRRSEKTLEWLRISFAKHECAAALRFSAEAKKKGYQIQFNPMDALGYSEEEREQLIYEVNKIKPGVLSIVDTFGAMHLDDLAAIFKQADSLLDKDIKIGLHSHDNLGLSCALVELMAMLAANTERDIVVDGSLYGMGRGAGNAATEAIASFLNKRCGKHYDIPVLLETIETHIKPLRSKAGWGYDLPMFICGAARAHVDNAYFLQNHTDCPIKDMYAVINAMPEAQRTRYGPNYSKSDFTDLQGAYNAYKGTERGQ